MQQVPIGEVRRAAEGRTGMAKMRDRMQIFYSGRASEALSIDGARDPMQSFYSRSRALPAGDIDLRDPMQTFYGGPKGRGRTESRDGMQRFYANR